MTLPDGTQIVVPPAVSNPSGVESTDIDPGHTQYAIGIRKDTTDMSPLTGKLVAWRKVYKPLDQLPAYRFCQDTLWPQGEQYLRMIAVDANRVIAEPEALGKTQAAETGNCQRVYPQRNPACLWQR